MCVGGSAICESFEAIATLENVERKIQAFKCGTTQEKSLQSLEPTGRADAMGKRFPTVAVGGTFDEFHKGHRALLLKAFEVGDHVLVGLCSDRFAEKLKKPHSLASYAQRLENLKAFLKEHDFLKRTEIIPLNDPYGVTLSKGCVEALVVSKETEPTATEINAKREKMNLPPLKIVIIEMVPSENHSPISTTRIRKGEIDHEGHLLRQKKNH